jgi:hypothetical protein
MIAMDTFFEKFPPTVGKAVEILNADITFADRTRLTNMSEAALIDFHRSYGLFIRREFRLPGNDPLMQDCQSVAAVTALTPEQASFVILKALQKRLMAGHRLKVVK